eukprot:6181995-Pleurochrysis_carterae.AAC.3
MGRDSPPDMFLIQRGGHTTRLKPLLVLANLCLSLELDMWQVGESAADKCNVKCMWLCPFMNLSPRGRASNIATQRVLHDSQQRARIGLTAKDARWDLEVAVCREPPDA